MNKKEYTMNATRCLLDELQKPENDADLGYIDYLVRRSAHERALSEMLSELSVQSLMEVTEYIKTKYKVDQLIGEAAFGKIGEPALCMDSHKDAKLDSIYRDRKLSAEQRLIHAIFSDDDDSE